MDVTIDDQVWLEKAQAVVAQMREKYSGTTVAIGEMQNGNAFEMALALTRYALSSVKSMPTSVPTTSSTSAIWLN